VSKNQRQGITGQLKMWKSKSKSGCKYEGKIQRLRGNKIPTEDPTAVVVVVYFLNNSSDKHRMEVAIVYWE